jgi:uncharacterized membrane protein YcaP (DUF421 family)
MQSVVRTVAVYLVLLVLFRIAGKRALAQVTTFDFILLLIISEAIQNALVGDDYSMTNAFVVVVTLLGADFALAVSTQRWPRLEKVVDDVPLVIVNDGRIIEDRVRKSSISEHDILDAARISHGLERMDQIKYAILERTGGISIVPQRSSDHRPSSGAKKHAKVT